MSTVDNPRRIVKTSQQRRELAGCRVFFQRQIRIEQRAFFLAGKRRAKERRQAEVVAPDTPLVIERGLKGGDYASPLFHIGTNLIALLRGERRDVGQDQRLEAVD